MTQFPIEPDSHGEQGDLFSSKTSKREAKQPDNDDDDDCNKDLLSYSTCFIYTGCLTHSITLGGMYYYFHSIGEEIEFRQVK